METAVNIIRLDPNRPDRTVRVFGRSSFRSQSFLVRQHDLCDSRDRSAFLFPVVILLGHDRLHIWGRAFDRPHNSQLFPGYFRSVYSTNNTNNLAFIYIYMVSKDGTSSVTFLPYIGTNFAKEYLIPNYIGESLAALVPSVLSLIQGLGQDPGCYNYTDPETNVTQLVPVPIIPTYSVQVFFLLMFGILCISTTSFTLLNFSPYARKHRKLLRPEPEFDAAADKEPSSNVSTLSESKVSSNESNKSPNGSFELINESRTPLNPPSPSETLVEISTGSNEKLILLTFTFFLSFFCYGVLPGLQSYSTLPYGN